MTSACHLCEQAKEVLWPLTNEFPLHLQEVDIADSDELLARYGVRIPVLMFIDGQEELGWPFDGAQLRDFLLLSSENR
jgi:hypothetical protein